MSPPPEGARLVRGLGWTAIEAWRTLPDGTIEVNRKISTVEEAREWIAEASTGRSSGASCGPMDPPPT